MIKWTLTCCFVLVMLSAFGAIRLPKLMSDGMVLQRNAKVKIWGWADTNENVSVYFMDGQYSTTASSSGEWEVHLDNLSAGGPFTMTIIGGGDTIEISDILVGDVWVCSGQSNMNYRLSNAKSIYGKDIAEAANPNIRNFTVPEVANFVSPQKDVSGGEWIAATSESVLNFSAVSYFFASELYEKYQVPIGLIHSSKSGSPAQAWVSKESFKEFPHYYEEALQYRDPLRIDSIRQAEQQREEAWYETVHATDAGYKSAGTWYSQNTDISDWQSINIPGFIAKEVGEKVNGVYWFRKEIQIPNSLLGRNAVFKMGNMVNSDSVYINGTFIGTTGHQWSSRSYEISADILKAGTNTIVLRLINHNGYGGFIDGYPNEIDFEEHTIDLSGEWKFKLGAEMESLPGPTPFNWKATGLYNGMIAPLTNYAIKGVIWYQGEGNTGKPVEYESLFPCMIKNWRNSWDQGVFPFLFVQLANYMKTSSKPSKSNWARLRESQRKTLSSPNTGMAVAIDVGVAHDVHPMNKKDVGYRLALEAQRVAYKDKSVVSSGPLYSSMKKTGESIEISFETFGGTLKIKDGDSLRYFAIAGNDRNFVWAKAKIEGNKVIVSHPDIRDPVAVRYAWANNPESANLVNEQGLPASPFRTDDWED